MEARSHTIGIGSTQLRPSTVSYSAKHCRSNARGEAKQSRRNAKPYLDESYTFPGVLVKSRNSKRSCDHRRELTHLLHNPGFKADDEAKLDGFGFRPDSNVMTATFTQTRFWNATTGPVRPVPVAELPPTGLYYQSLAVLSFTAFLAMLWDHIGGGVILGAVSKKVSSSGSQ